MATTNYALPTYPTVAGHTILNDLTTAFTTIDSTLKAVSDNTEGKQNKLTFDTTPTADSTNPVTSGGIKKALDDIVAAGVTVDATITETGTNPVEGKAIYTALAGKADAFTASNAVTENDENPVTSGAVYTANKALADRITALENAISISQWNDYVASLS